MIKRKYLVISLFILAILVAGVLGFKYFANSSAKKIEIKNEVAENDSLAEAVSEENAEVAPEEMKDNFEAVEPSKTESQGKKETVVEKTESAGKTNISNKLVSWGFEKASGRKIDTIVIHSTYNALGGDQFSLEKILAIYKSYGVAPHYIIDRGGKIYRLVADENIAYHAGESQVSDGRTGVNNFSIGIEIINSKAEKPANDQYASLNDLLRYLRSEYKIKYVLGHDQIAPGRKDDPWNLDWSRVAK